MQPWLVVGYAAGPGAAWSIPLLVFGMLGWYYVIKDFRKKKKK
jgi:hypothetical protein